MKTIIAMGLIMLTGCTGSVSMSEHAQISGTPEGLRSMGEVLASMISEGKATPDSQGAYWKQRAMHEQQLTDRALNKKGLFSFLDKNEGQK